MSFTGVAPTEFAIETYARLAEETDMFDDYTVGIGLWNSASKRFEAVLGIRRAYPKYEIGWESLSDSFSQWEEYQGLPESDIGVYFRIERSPDDTFGTFEASWRQTALDNWTPFTHRATYADFNSSFNDLTLWVCQILFPARLPRNSLCA
jgi:hypothetical protein